MSVTYSSSAQTPVEVLPSGHIIIKASVNGVEGKFFFDTGGGINLLTKKFADKVKNIKKEDGYFTGFRATGERLDVPLYKAQTISIGNWTYKQPTLTILDVDLASYDGLISMNLFENQPFTLDLNQNLFTLETAKSLDKKQGQKVGLQIQKERGVAVSLFTYVVLNETDTLQFSLDSGAGNNTFSIHSRYAQSTGIDLSDTTKVKSFLRKSEFNPNVQTGYYVTSVKKLQLKDAAPVNIENFTTRFTTDLIYDGIMSINWFGKVISIDIKNATMIVGK
ncbi:retropepsin-like aspartic protease [Xanthocytophaga flava]|uniref:retropepsin-like aspartic protease n=1 Tax=Xanthocytophaga flava TaxID=3048013 RepID=UPI0028D7D54E|nr:retropepsin-like aspartic protease [Xanthocytophaga flavus]